MHVGKEYNKYKRRFVFCLGKCYGARVLSFIAFAASVQSQYSEQSKSCFGIIIKIYLTLQTASWELPGGTMDHILTTAVLIETSGHYYFNLMVSLYRWD